MERAHRTGCRSKVSKHGEARLLRIVRKSQGIVLKDKTTDFNNGNQGELISECTVKRILHTNKIYREVVKKHIVVKEVKVE